MKQTWDKFLSGDKRALETIYKSTYNSLMNYGLTLTDRETVSDSIQQVYFRLIERRSNLSSVENVKAYLITALRREIMKRLKEKTPDLNEFYTELPDDYRLVKITHLITQLPQKEKEIINLKFYQDLSYQEITKILNINYDSARKLLHRAITKLREMSNQKQIS